MWSFFLWQLAHTRTEFVVNIRAPHFRQRFHALGSSSIAWLGIFCLLLSG